MPLLNSGKVSEDMFGKVKPLIVVYWNWVPVKNTEKKGDEEVPMKPVLRYYNVFHISQVDGVEPLAEEEIELEPLEEAEKV